MKAVAITGIVLQESHFKVGDYKYRAVDLIEAAKDIEAFKLPLQGVDIGLLPWTVDSIKDFLHHYKRVESVNKDYPIILSNTGCICDGWHRLARAIIDGDKFIMAKRLEVMPDCI